jgi:heme/copper-type cytochrome/quinol oxidase subunit 2
MLNLLITIIIIFTLLLTWVLVQQAARKFAANHPELGQAKFIRLLMTVFPVNGISWMMRMAFSHRFFR